MNEELSDLVKITNEMVKYRTLCEEADHRYTKMKKVFLELIDEAESYRDRLGLESESWKYDIIEDSGLLDDYE
jgi:hypothetical protein